MTLKRVEDIEAVCTHACSDSIPMFQFRNVSRFRGGCGNRVEEGGESHDSLPSATSVHPSQPSKLLASVACFVADRQRRSHKARRRRSKTPHPPHRGQGEGSRQSFRRPAAEAARDGEESGQFMMSTERRGEDRL